MKPRFVEALGFGGVGAAMIFLSMSSFGQSGGGGGSTPTPCPWSVGGDTTTLTSTLKCCSNVTCAAVYDQCILGQWCLPGNTLIDCNCSNVSTTLFQYQNGSCVGSCSGSTTGNCLFGTLIASVPWTYPVCGGTACTSGQ